MAEQRIVIVGAGPAGIRAAASLVAAGLRPTLIDEAPKAGGQIYRQQPDGFQRGATTLYGFEAGKAERLHKLHANLAGRIDYRPGTLVWNIWERQVFTLRDGTAEAIPFDHLLIATGAMDRIFPLPGWTLPGVYSMGGAQVALKYQGCAIGREIVFVGTGPLLYLVAYQYAKAGAGVRAVLDITPRDAKLRALAGLAADPLTLGKGVYYRTALRLRGVDLVEGATPLAILGEGRVAGLRYDAGAGPREIACDAVAFGCGLRSETQLADLAGCEFRFHGVQRQWLPERDAEGKSSVPGVWLAGDGGEIGGADVAELAGERVGLAIAAAAGRPAAPGRIAAIDRRLVRLARFRAGLNAAFPFPARLAAAAGDAVTLCRCEGIAVGEARRAARELGAQEVNRLKAFTRIGMGRCQGRLCGEAAAEILADALKCDIAAVGRLRGQAPAKPIPMPVKGLA